MKKYTYYDLEGDKNSYQWILEMAGAKVLYFKDYGSYQGSWLAKVEHKGETGWVFDSYGSCSGCDAFEAEAGWKDKTKAEWEKFCTNFAKAYLDPLKTWDEVYKQVKDDAEWDTDAKEALAFLESHK